MDDLIAFLNARYDEDAETATAAAGNCQPDPDWAVIPDDRGSAIIRDSGGGVVVYDEGSPSLDEARHIARHDPARVFADVEAKRRILALHPMSDYPGRPDRFEDYCDGCGSREYPVTWPCDTVRLLALPFSGHPDYQEAWRP